MRSKAIVAWSFTAICERLWGAVYPSQHSLVMQSLVATSIQSLACPYSCLRSVYQPWMLKSNRSLVKCHEMTSSNSKDRRSWWTRNTFKFTKSATLQQCRLHASIEQLRFLSARVWQWPSSIYTLYSLFPPYEHGTRRAPWLEGLPSAILQGLCFVSPYRPDKAANNR